MVWRVCITDEVNAMNEEEEDEEGDMDGAEEEGEGDMEEMQAGEGSAGVKEACLVCMDYWLIIYWSLHISQ